MKDDRVYLETERFKMHLDEQLGCIDRGSKGKAGNDLLRESV